MRNIFQIMVMALLLVFALVSTYYYRFVLRSDIVVSHFFYIPVVLAGFWWKRRGIWVSFLLSFSLLLTHYFSSNALRDMVADLLRSFMLISVSSVVAILKEQSDRAKLRLLEFSRKILTIREEEKTRIAVDLHDELGAMSVAVNSNLDILEEELDSAGQGSDSMKCLARTRDIFKRTVSGLKRISVELRPPDLDIIGLEDVLRQYCRGWADNSKVEISVNIDLKGQKLREDISIALYRLTQEALNNVVKHSSATMVWVNMSWEERDITLEVKDNGRGFNPDSIYHGSGDVKIGIEGMRQRMEALGGIFSVISSKGCGCLIRVCVPNGTADK